jgi:hypothetical protein
MHELDLNTDRFRLEIPSEPSWLATVRIFVGAVARVCGIDGDADEELVADLKLAASEAAAGVISGGEARTIVVEAGVGEAGRVWFSVGPVSAANLTTDAPGPQPIDVIAALLPGAEVGGGVFSFEAVSGASAP